MSRPAFLVHRIGPNATLQDAGRSGGLAFGLSRSGAADAIALAEGAALLGQGTGCAALEMTGTGGVFEALSDLRIALTGAPMSAECDGASLRWNASHRVAKGSRLTLGAARDGVYSYLHTGGGFDGPVLLGSRSAHLATGVMVPVAAGDTMTAWADTGTETGLTLDPQPRFGGGALRVVPSAQTGLFAEADLARFETTAFVKDHRANRMGVRLGGQGAGFFPDGGLSVVSDVVTAGDIQITGDGAPFVLLNECQTTGGYPRIGTVLPCDLPRVAQAQAGAAFHFGFVSLEAAIDLHRAYRAALDGLRRSVRPLVRDPHDIADLLSYQLISGVTAGDEE